MEARIPFGGFYESMWSAGVDDEENQQAERLSEEHGIKLGDINELLFKHSRYHQGYAYIAEKYAPAFLDVINSELGLDLKMTFKDMTSPKFYNFETDRIFVDITYRDVLRLARKVGRNALRKAAKDMFTSRDGFSSFYDPDISTWGPMRTWDHNQLYALMTAAVDSITADYEDYAWAIYEDFSSNGVFCEAFDKACDWQTVMLEIGKLVGAKELAEELAEEDDGRRFPVAWHNTADYVERYHKMNSNQLSEGPL